MTERYSKDKKYFVHPSSCVDENVSIGEGAKIWHFSHILKNSKIGKNCIIGQNVSIGPGKFQDIERSFSINLQVSPRIF